MFLVSALTDPASSSLCSEKNTLASILSIPLNVCLAGAVANVADSDRCRCNPKVPSSIPAGGKDFP